MKKKKNKDCTMSVRLINKNGNMYQFTDEAIKQMNDQLQDKIKQGIAVVHLLETSINPFATPAMEDAIGLIKSSEIKSDGIYATVHFIGEAHKSVINNGKLIVKKPIFAPRAENFDIDSTHVTGVQGLQSIDLVVNKIIKPNIDEK